jgi:hypothetical protein
VEGFCERGNEFLGAVNCENVCAALRYLVCDTGPSEGSRGGKISEIDRFHLSLF